MGWYLRKSLKVGPLRFNLSKSGVGTSIGVKGFRVGTGPRGRYVHAGRGGLYFRQSLPSSDKKFDDSSEAALPDEFRSEQDVPSKDGLVRFIRRLFRGR